MADSDAGASRSNFMLQMSDELRSLVENFSGFHKAYCEYRSKGLSQALAAEKAGSTASTRVALQSVGFSIEQNEGVKEYIEFLKDRRAEVMPIDELELISKLRDVYTEAMSLGKLRDANVAIELMATLAGLMKNAKTGPKEKIEGEGTKNNTDAFKDEGVVTDLTERLNKLQSMTKDIKKE